MAIELQLTGPLRQQVALSSLDLLYSTVGSSSVKLSAKGWPEEATEDFK